MLARVGEEQKTNAARCVMLLFLSAFINSKKIELRGFQRVQVTIITTAFLQYFPVITCKPM
jgi:hypothetical protein